MISFFVCVAVADGAAKRKGSKILLYTVFLKKYYGLRLMNST